MAKVRKTAKQIAWKKLEKRISQRIKQGYTPTNLPSYSKLTAKQIEKLKYKELDVYFERVNVETGEIQTPKEYRQEQRRIRKELGYETIPSTSILPTSYDIFEQIRDKLDEIPSVFYGRVKGGLWTEYYWQNDYPLRQIFERAVATKDNDELSKFYLAHESEIMMSLETAIYSSDQESFVTQLSRASILLKGGEPLSLIEAQQLSDLLEQMEGE